MSLFRRSEEERQLLSFYRPWYRRPSVWLAISLPALLLARLALTPLAWYEVHKRLASLPDYEVSFSSLSLAILRKQIIFRNVKVHHRGQGGGKDGDAWATIPFVQIDVPLWRLVRGGPVEAITLIDPVFRLRTDAALALDQQAKLAWAHSARPLPLSEIKNLRIERGTVLAAEQHGSPQANDRALFRELDIVISGLGFGNQGVADVVHARVNGGLMIGSGITKGQAEFTLDHEGLAFRTAPDLAREP